MLSLNLGPSHPIKLVPASSVPDRADGHLCDNCGRDLTKHFRRGHAHAWSPMGPVRFNCACGKSYLTGAMEWEHLSQFERRRRLREILGIGIVLSAASSIIALVTCLVLHFVFRFDRVALITATVITWFPFALVQVSFWPGVVQSIIRTRFSRND